MLIAGIIIIGVLFSFPQVETVYQISVDITTTGWYNSDKFRAESGCWRDIDISSTEASALHIVGQTVGEIFTVEGSTYKYSVSISRGDVYQVQVENKHGHHEWFGFVWVPDENHFSGNFHLKRTPEYYYSFLLSGAIILVIGLVLIPSVSYMEYQARQKAKREYECPRCRKTVSVGLKVCPYCKLDLTKYWVRCKYCKRLYDSHYDRCPRCGSPTEE